MEAHHAQVTGIVRALTPHLVLVDRSGRVWTIESPEPPAISIGTRVMALCDLDAGPTGLSLRLNTLREAPDYSAAASEAASG